MKHPQNEGRCTRQANTISSNDEGCRRENAVAWQPPMYGIDVLDAQEVGGGRHWLLH